jgi:hypothetical protein
VTVVSALGLGVRPLQAVLTGSISGAFVTVCGRRAVRRRVLGGVEADTEIRSRGAFAVVLVSLAGLTTAGSVPFHVAAAGLLATLTAFGVGLTTGQSTAEG